MALQTRTPGGFVVEVGVEHDHIPAHLHFMGHATGHPDRALRWHHPVAIMAANLHHPSRAVEQLRAPV